MRSWPTRNCASLSAYPLLYSDKWQKHCTWNFNTLQPWIYTKKSAQSASSNDLWTTLLDRSVHVWCHSQPPPWKSLRLLEDPPLVWWTCMAHAIDTSSPKLKSSQASVVPLGAHCCCTTMGIRIVLITTKAAVLFLPKKAAVLLVLLSAVVFPINFISYL